MNRKTIISKVMAKLGMGLVTPKDIKDFIKENPASIKDYINKHYPLTGMGFIRSLTKYLDSMPMHALPPLQLGDILRKLIKEDYYTEKQLIEKLPSHKKFIEMSLGQKYVDI